MISIKLNLKIVIFIYLRYIFYELWGEYELYRL